MYFFIFWQFANWHHIWRSKESEAQMIQCLSGAPSDPMVVGNNTNQLYDVVRSTAVLLRLTIDLKDGHISWFNRRRRWSTASVQAWSMLYHKYHPFCRSAARCRDLSQRTMFSSRMNYLTNMMAMGWLQK